MAWLFWCGHLSFKQRGMRHSYDHTDGWRMSSLSPPCKEGLEDEWVPSTQPWTVSLPHPWLKELSMNKAAAGQGPGGGSHLWVIGFKGLHHHVPMGGPEGHVGKAPVALC